MTLATNGLVHLKCDMKVSFSKDCDALKLNYSQFLYSSHSLQYIHLPIIIKMSNPLYYHICFHLFIYMGFKFAFNTE